MEDDRPVCAALVFARPQPRFSNHGGRFSSCGRSPYSVREAARSNDYSHLPRACSQRAEKTCSEASASSSFPRKSMYSWSPSFSLAT